MSLTVIRLIRWDNKQIVKKQTTLVPVPPSQPTVQSDTQENPGLGKGLGKKKKKKKGGLVLNKSLLLGNYDKSNTQQSNSFGGSLQSQQQSFSNNSVDALLDKKRENDYAVHTQPQLILIKRDYSLQEVQLLLSTFLGIKFDEMRIYFVQKLPVVRRDVKKFGRWIGTYEQQNQKDDNNFDDEQKQDQQFSQYKYVNQTQVQPTLLHPSTLQPLQQQIPKISQEETDLIKATIASIGDQHQIEFKNEIRQIGKFEQNNKNDPKDVIEQQDEIEQKKKNKQKEEIEPKDDVHNKDIDDGTDKEDKQQQTDLIEWKCDKWTVIGYRRGKGNKKDVGEWEQYDSDMFDDFGYDYDSEKHVKQLAISN
ncbi:MAG: hypothetical protein EZS28_017653 [Streblomastix strix]|uniref:Uncharacterized protein n=1 Tax=Streblomastix strix TaxID=222440 RepID=A0A5J4VX11_9EUKA|nr:MAG: hypothetical protein EZS28_017653 [Streblomastix strix]